MCCFVTSVKHLIAILTDRLRYYGFTKIILLLMQSYLTNRYQYLLKNYLKSDLMKTEKGVPQGSVLCPILFLIYIIDISFGTHTEGYEYYYIL